jgi:hypothetical protein
MERFIIEPLYTRNGYEYIDPSEFIYDRNEIKAFDNLSNLPDIAAISRDTNLSTISGILAAVKPRFRVQPVAEKRVISPQ